MSEPCPGKTKKWNQWIRNLIKLKFLPRFSVSSVVGEDCLIKSEKLNFGIFPNVNVEDVSVVFDENWKSVGVVILPKLAKEYSELPILDGLLLSSFVVTIRISK